MIQYRTRPGFGGLLRRRGSAGRRGSGTEADRHRDAVAHEPDHQRGPGPEQQACPSASVPSQWGASGGSGAPSGDSPSEGRSSGERALEPGRRGRAHHHGRNDEERRGRGGAPGEGVQAGAHPAPTARIARSSSRPPPVRGRDGPIGFESQVPPEPSRPEGEHSPPRLPVRQRRCLLGLPARSGVRLGGLHAVRRAGPGPRAFQPRPPDAARTRAAPSSSPSHAGSSGAKRARR